MGTSVLVNDCLEGDEVEGQCRHPPEYRGKTKSNNLDVYYWILRHDVKSKIVETLSIPMDRPDEHILNPQENISKLVSEGDDLICEIANLYTKKKKIVRDVGKGSATHQTNKFYISKQTAVKVTRAHQEIENSKRKKISSSDDENDLK